MAKAVFSDPFLGCRLCSQRGQRGSGQSESRDILGRTPWLQEIGRWVRTGYDVVDPSVPPHLAALLTEAGYTAHEIAA